MLIIFEMANNHNGSIDRAKRIIDGVAKIAFDHSIDAMIKFQYRSYDFIHSGFTNSEYKHVRRFVETRISYKGYEELEEYALSKDIGVLVTPFDESAVDRITGDIIKIASCSVQDWPLLEKIADTGKAVIISTGGATEKDIDNVVSYFRHKGNNISLMHCVSEYPTRDNFNLNYIETLRNRYGVTVGYSGHENPYQTDVCKIAVANGAEIMERHIGIDELNAYSMDMQRAEVWVMAIRESMELCGSYEKTVSEDEKENIKSLQRGAYASEPMSIGDSINSDNVYYAFPCTGIDSGSVGKYRNTMTATKDYTEGQAIKETNNIDTHIATLRGYVHKARGLIMEAGIKLGDVYTVELSHHYGLGNFDSWGAVIINLINREYCKKLIIMFPGQSHPEHYHAKKEETFHVLSGSMRVEGAFDCEVNAGDLLLVERHRPHSFHTIDGCIFEEISTTHIRGDSFYSDDRIYLSDPMERKTIIEKL